MPKRPAQINPGGGKQGVDVKPKHVRKQTKSVSSDTQSSPAPARRRGRPKKQVATVIDNAVPLASTNAEPLAPTVRNVCVTLERLRANMLNPDSVSPRMWLDEELLPYLLGEDLIRTPETDSRLVDGSGGGNTGVIGGSSSVTDPVIDLASESSNPECIFSSLFPSHVCVENQSSGFMRSHIVSQGSKHSDNDTQVQTSFLADCSPTQPNSVVLPDIVPERSVFSLEQEVEKHSESWAQPNKLNNSQFNKQIAAFLQSDRELPVKSTSAFSTSVVSGDNCPITNLDDCDPISNAFTPPTVMTQFKTEANNHSKYGVAESLVSLSEGTKLNVRTNRVKRRHKSEAKSMTEAKTEIRNSGLDSSQHEKDHHLFPDDDETHEKVKSSDTIKCEQAGLRVGLPTSNCLSTVDLNCKYPVKYKGCKVTSRKSKPKAREKQIKFKISNVEVESMTNNNINDCGWVENRYSNKVAQLKLVVPRLEHLCSSCMKCLEFELIPSSSCKAFTSLNKCAPVDSASSVLFEDPVFTSQLPPATTTDTDIFVLQQEPEVKRRRPFRKQTARKSFPSKSIPSSIPRFIPKSIPSFKDEKRRSNSEQSCIVNSTPLDEIEGEEQFVPDYIYDEDDEDDGDIAVHCSLENALIIDSSVNDHTDFTDKSLDTSQSEEFTDHDIGIESVSVCRCIEGESFYSGCNKCGTKTKGQVQDCVGGKSSPNLPISCTESATCSLSPIDTGSDEKSKSNSGSPQNSRTNLSKYDLSLDSVEEGQLDHSQTVNKNKKESNFVEDLEGECLDYFSDDMKINRNNFTTPKESTKKLHNEEEKHTGVFQSQEKTLTVKLPECFQNLDVIPKKSAVAVDRSLQPTLALVQVPVPTEAARTDSKNASASATTKLTSPPTNKQTSVQKPSRKIQHLENEIVHDKLLKKEKPVSQAIQGRRNIAGLSVTVPNVKIPTTIQKAKAPVASPVQQPKPKDLLNPTPSLQTVKFLADIKPVKARRKRSTEHRQNVEKLVQKKESESLSVPHKKDLEILPGVLSHNALDGYHIPKKPQITHERESPVVPTKKRKEPSKSVKTEQPMISQLTKDDASPNTKSKRDRIKAISQKILEDSRSSLSIGTTSQNTMTNKQHTHHEPSESIDTVSGKEQSASDELGILEEGDEILEFMDDDACDDHVEKDSLCYQSRTDITPMVVGNSVANEANQNAYRTSQSIGSSKASALESEESLTGFTNVNQAICNVVKSNQKSRTISLRRPWKSGGDGESGASSPASVSSTKQTADSMNTKDNIDNTDSGLPKDMTEGSDLMSGEDQHRYGSIKGIRRKKVPSRSPKILKKLDAAPVPQHEDPEDPPLEDPPLEDTEDLPLKDQEDPPLEEEPNNVFKLHAEEEGFLTEEEDNDMPQVGNRKIFSKEPKTELPDKQSSNSNDSSTGSSVHNKAAVQPRIPRRESRFSDNVPVDVGNPSIVKQEERKESYPSGRISDPSGRTYDRSYRTDSREHWDSRRGANDRSPKHRSNERSPKYGNNDRSANVRPNWGEKNDRAFKQDGYRSDSRRIDEKSVGNRNEPNRSNDRLHNDAYDSRTNYESRTEDWSSHSAGRPVRHSDRPFRRNEGSTERQDSVRYGRSPDQEYRNPEDRRWPDPPRQLDERTGSRRDMAQNQRPDVDNYEGPSYDYAPWRYDEDYKADEIKQENDDGHRRGARNPRSDRWNRPSRNEDPLPDRWTRDRPPPGYRDRDAGGGQPPVQPYMPPPQKQTESLGNPISHLRAADIEPDSEGVLQETILSFAELGRTGKWASLADRLNQLVTFADKQNYQRYLYYFALAVTDTTASEHVSQNFQELIQGLEKTRASQLEPKVKLVVGTIGLMGITLCADKRRWKDAYTLLYYLHDKEIMYTFPIVSKPIPMFKIVLTVVEVCLAVGEPLTVIDAMDQVNWFETNESTMDRMKMDRMRVEMLCEVLKRLKRFITDTYIPHDVKEKVVDLLYRFYSKMASNINKDVRAFHDTQSYENYVDHNSLLNDLCKIGMEYRSSDLLRALLKAADVYPNFCKFRHVDIRPIVRFFYRLSLTRPEFFKDAYCAYKMGLTLDIYPISKKFDLRTGGMLQLWFTMTEEEMHLAVEYYLDQLVVNWMNLGKDRTNCCIRLSIHLVAMPRPAMVSLRAYRGEMNNPCSKKEALDKVMDTLKKDMNPPLIWSSYNDGIFHIDSNALLDALYPKLVKYLTESSAAGDSFNLPPMRSKKPKGPSVVYDDFHKAGIVTTGGSWKPPPTINESILSADNSVGNGLLGQITPGHTSEQFNNFPGQFGDGTSIHNPDLDSPHSDTLQDRMMEIAVNQNLNTRKRPSSIISHHSGGSPAANLTQMPGNLSTTEPDQTIPKKKMGISQFLQQSLLNKQPGQEEEWLTPPSYQFPGQNQPLPVSKPSQSPFHHPGAVSTVTSQSAFSPANTGAQMSIDEDCMDTDILLQQTSPFSAGMDFSPSTYEPKFVSPSRLVQSSAMPRQLPPSHSTTFPMQSGNVNQQHGTPTRQVVAMNSPDHQINLVKRPSLLGTPPVRDKGVAMSEPSMGMSTPHIDPGAGMPSVPQLGRGRQRGAGRGGMIQGPQHNVRPPFQVHGRPFQRGGPNSRNFMRGRMNTHHRPPLNRKHWVPQEQESVHEQFSEGQGSLPSHHIPSLMDPIASQGFQPHPGQWGSIQRSVPVPGSTQQSLQAAEPQRRVFLQSQQYTPDSAPLGGLLNNTGSPLHMQVRDAISDRLGHYIKHHIVPEANYNDLIASITSGFLKEDIVKQSPEQNLTNPMFAELIKYVDRVIAEVVTD